MDENALFQAGNNIAIKVPAHRHAETVSFYRDVVRLPLVEERTDTAVFEFGPMRLWLDRVEHQSQTDVWLELRTPDLAGAMTELQKAAAPTRDGLEPLGDLPGHWISDPAGVVLLVHEEK